VSDFDSYFNGAGTMKILKFVKNGLAIAAFAAMGALSSGALAADAVIDCCFVTGLNSLQDTDADRILRGGTVITSGQFMTGDVIQSMLRIDTVNTNPINGAVGTLNYQLTALATLTITSIVDITGGSCDVGDQCIARTSASVSAYEIPNGTNYLAQAPVTGFANVVSAGTLVLTLGTTAADDFWFIQFTNTGNTIGSIATAPQGSSQQGLYVFGVSATSNPGNIPFLPNSILDGRTPATCPICGAPTLHDFVGNGSGYALDTSGGGTNTGYLLSTNTTVLFNVPEPGTLALLGLGLVATWFGGIRRKA